MSSNNTYRKVHTFITELSAHGIMEMHYTEAYQFIKFPRKSSSKFHFVANYKLKESEESYASKQISLFL
jgi:hypothetical protein